MNPSTKLEYKKMPHHAPYFFAKYIPPQGCKAILQRIWLVPQGMRSSVVVMLYRCYNCSSRAGSHVLGIETSCDDTGIAIVDEKGEFWPRLYPLSGMCMKSMGAYILY